MSSSKYIKFIHETLQAEVDVLKLNLDNPYFLKQIEQAALLAKTSPRLIITGMGKSGLIARKVAATLTSTGSPSVYLHPADALHGDIGNIQAKEVVLAYSNSGETKEIIELLPHIKVLGGKVIAISGKEDSALVKQADVSIIYKVEKEGCPLNLAPMASTTISLAIGDALTTALIKMKQFKADDFSRFHPAGSLGKKLLTKVNDVLQKHEMLFISKDALFHDILTSMVSANMGAVIILGSKGHLRGIITDGDLKRILQHSEKDSNIWKLTAQDIMNTSPSYVYNDILVEEALSIMYENKINVLPVLDKNKRSIGIIRMLDLIGL